MEKSANGIDLHHFLENHGKRLRWFIFRFIRQNRLERSDFDDLWQTALLSLLSSLPYWKPSGGRNPFNFVAPSLLKAFRRECRHSLRKRVLLEDGQKLEKSGIGMGNGTSVGIGSGALANSDSLAQAIDLRRLLERDPKPAQVVRFIAHALSPASGGDLARLDGLSRQAFYARRKAIQARLVSNLA